MRTYHALALAGLAVVAAGCGGDKSATATDAPAQSQGGMPQSAGFGHVHGLGIDPGDGALMIATHTGLFRAPPGTAKATRVGDSEQDVMGFTVTGPHRFLASGHPAPGTPGQPPSLGLISSSNGGRAWQDVSLSGAADFHVLRSQGDAVVGYNALAGALMVSSNGGRSWQQRQAPGPLIDLAVSPTDPRRFVASTDQALMTSLDDGRRWRLLRRDAIGLLAWAQMKQLVWVDANGTVSKSSDLGATWQRRGSIGGQPAAFAADGTELLAALGDGTVLHSTNGGRTWAVRARP